MVLRAARKQSGKTQAKVAQEAMLSETQYQNIEYNKCEPRVLNAIRIADAIGVPITNEFRSLWEQSTSKRGYKRKAQDRAGA